MKNSILVLVVIACTITIASAKSDDRCYPAKNTTCLTGPQIKLATYNLSADAHDLKTLVDTMSLTVANLKQTDEKVTAIIKRNTLIQNMVSFRNVTLLCPNNAPTVRKSMSLLDERCNGTRNALDLLTNAMGKEGTTAATALKGLQYQSTALAQMADEAVVLLKRLQGVVAAGGDFENSHLVFTKVSFVLQKEVAQFPAPL
ncbi:hypothetical protein SeMB42_g00683 [Synchytrium endobioticum]|uniref:Pectinesterase inhibitor domain-containing protein n=1 Tax=Synchytrium endobioticum TaxID=286115 RepID=A0A507DPE4_9FUNG|nr:hypothetical protein SeLEV6574_g02152 [Synchytrium endobioticum]TPX53589.1 hypothetical protein SeMB42_g00683 [Synchytrium endobioticum]